jgi:ApeA N-terminal domain 1
MSHDVRRASYAGSVSEKDRAALLAGEAVVGQFQVAGADDVVPGVLRWSAESGATLDLIDDASGFPRTFAVPRFHVYGVLRHGAEVTLHDCLLRRLAFVDQPTHVSASTLAFGAQVLPQTIWPRAIYSTAALSEWRNDSGMRFYKPAPRKRAETQELFQAARQEKMRVSHDGLVRIRIAIAPAMEAIRGLRQWLDYGAFQGWLAKPPVGALLRRAASDPDFRGALVAELRPDGQPSMLCTGITLLGATGHLVGDVRDMAERLVGGAFRGSHADVLGMDVLSGRVRPLAWCLHEALNG